MIQRNDIIRNAGFIVTLKCSAVLKPFLSPLSYEKKGQRGVYEERNVREVNVQD
jgi:hypothetical protein